MKFSKDIANLILNKVNNKGWNLYNSDDVAKIGANETIRKNLANNLEAGVRYVLLPKIDDPTNPEKIFKTLDLISKYLPKKLPEIYIDLKFQSFVGFILEQDNVRVITQKGSIVHYDNFIYYLEGITKLNI